MKAIIGFVFGICVASAMAQSPPDHAAPAIRMLEETLSVRDPTPAIRMDSQGYLIAGGTKPDGSHSPIMLGADGYVICSVAQK